LCKWVTKELRPGITEADAVAAAYFVAASEGAGIYFCAVSSEELVGSYTSKTQPGFSKNKFFVIF